MTPERRYEIEHTTPAEQEMIYRAWLEHGEILAVTREVTVEELRELYPDKAIKADF
jgi:hypothetical protein